MSTATRTLTLEDVAGILALSADAAQTKEVYARVDRLFSLGASAILNAPIRHAGRRLGTLNCCGMANTYGSKEIEAAKTLANLLVPTLLSGERR